MRYLVTDLESTGINIASTEVISGCLIVLNEELYEIDRLSFKCRVDHWLDRYDGSIEIHGMTKKKVMKFPDKRQELKRVFNFISKHFIESGEPLSFVCHAKCDGPDGAITHYDYALLKQEFLDQSIFDYYNFITFCPDRLIVSTHTLSKGLDVENRRLSTLCKYFNIELNHHNAESDAEACAELLRRLKDLNHDTSNSLTKETISRGDKRIVLKNSSKEDFGAREHNLSLI